MEHCEGMNCSDAIKSYMRCALGEGRCSFGKNMQNAYAVKLIEVKSD